ncbi:CGNR zinc finger domain-containing protein [Mycobacterium sp. 21AC1]|uniref:CGNR zinc finger domain-containing protein n=1 Tax=[Mycobacterium] appelbergii TaxID=2939269 RepID=UPI002938FA35|nr:CGNR zinc finger domain-containing protein [Mycobacterium sp. 21AC1]MDV3129972.1 CGNR zinc finger domain-containing protein [Mycobacterium sp. 21AC1]
MDVVAIDPRDEVLLLDLLNTTPVVDGVRRDDLAAGRSARAWLREHGIAQTDPELAGLVAARTVLQAVVSGTQSPAALAPFLDEVALVPTVTSEGVDWRLRTDSAVSGAVRAVLAWDALRITSPGRLRPCANDECRLFLLDRSKPNSARWCSMAICGNRMKARRHYQRAKSTGSDYTGG